MRILVLSDTHGDTRTMLKAIERNPGAEMIIHCGDGRDQIELLEKSFPDKQIVAVRGNCDAGRAYRTEQLVTVNGKTIFVTHGHLFQVKFSPYNLICAARERGADIVCFGHTHNAMCEYQDGLYILNPGSCHGYRASYGYIDITDKGDIVTRAVRLDGEI